MSNAQDVIVARNQFKRIVAERDALRDEVERLREVINLACLYSVDDEHDYADIERITRAALEPKP